MGKVAQIEALELGNGIQYLLDSAYKVLGNPIFLFDVNFNMLAFNDVPMDDPIWNEFVSTCTLSKETLEFLASERITEDVVNADRFIVIRRDWIKYARMSGHIVNRDGIVVGLLTMYECNNAFETEIMAAFEALVDRTVSEIRDYDYFTMLPLTYHEDTINLLLDGAVVNPFLFNPQAQMLYDSFDEYLFLAVVSLDRNDMLEHVHQNRLSYFKSMLKSQYPSNKYSIYSDYIVMLMSSKHRHSLGAQMLTAHIVLFEQNGLCMGISEGFENMYELRKYYDQAVTALTSGLARNSGQRVFLHNG